MTEKTTVEKLTEVKTKLTEIDSQVSALEGRKQQILEDLKTKFGFDTVEDAEKHLEELSKDIEEKDKEIGIQLEKLDKDLDDSGIEV